MPTLDWPKGHEIGLASELRLRRIA
jgi:hypothetical protein